MTPERLINLWFGESQSTPAFLRKNFRKCKYCLTERRLTVDFHRGGYVWIELI